MNFYKNVIEHKGKLLIRGVMNGKDYKEKIDFGPTLYALSQTEKTEHTEQKWFRSSKTISQAQQLSSPDWLMCALTRVRFLHF